MNSNWLIGVFMTVACGVACTGPAEGERAFFGGDPETRHDSVGAALSARADLVVALSGPSAAEPGETLSYTVTTSNVGGSSASSVQVTVTLPAGASALQADSGCSLLSAPARVRCSLQGLGAGASKSRSFTASVPTQPGPATFAALGTTRSRESTTANNSASLTTHVAVPAPPVPTLVPPQVLSASACYGVDTYAECVPEALVYADLLLQDFGVIDTYTPGVVGEWSQPSGPGSLRMVFSDALDDVLYSTFTGTAVSASCFQGAIATPSGLTGGFEACAD